MSKSSNSRNYDGNISNSRKYGYIDKKGDLAISFLFDEAFSFSSGLAAVHKDGKCEYINKSGKLEIPNIYQRCKRFSEDLAAVKFQNRWGYIDRSGKLIIPYQFRLAYDFKRGLASVRKLGQIVLSDTNPYADDYDAASFDDAVDASYINHKGEYIFESKID